LSPAQVSLGGGNEPDFRTRELSLRQSKLQVACGPSELYDAYRAIGLAFEALEHGRYARTNHIQRLVKAGNLDGGTLRWKLPQGGNSIPMNAGRPSDRNLDVS